MVYRVGLRRSPKTGWSGIYIRGWKEGGWGVGWGPILVERR